MKSLTVRERPSLSWPKTLLLTALSMALLAFWGVLFTACSSAASMDEGENRVEILPTMMEWEDGYVTDGATGDRPGIIGDEHRRHRGGFSDTAPLGIGDEPPGGAVTGGGNGKIPSATAEEDLADGIAGGIGGTQPGNAYGNGMRDRGEAAALTEPLAENDGLMRGIWGLLAALAVVALMIGFGLLLLPKPEKKDRNR